MIIFLMGVSGCGKTSVGEALSQEFHWTFQDGDNFHSETNRTKMANGVSLTDEDRVPWLQSLSELALNHLKTSSATHPAKLSDPLPVSILSNLSTSSDLTVLVIACSGLKKEYRRMLSNNIPKNKLLFVHLKLSEDLAAERLKTRKGHFFEPKLLKNQFDTLESPSEDEGIGYLLVVNVEQKLTDICQLISSFVSQIKD